MIEYSLLFFISLLFLTFLNMLLKKYNFSIDKTSGHEKHKLLLQFNDNIPLSGSFYFSEEKIIVNYFFLNQYK